MNAFTRTIRYRTKKNNIFDLSGRFEFVNDDIVDGKQYFRRNFRIPTTN